MIGEFPPHIGGAGMHTYTLAKELTQKGHEVFVITYPHKNIKDIDKIHVLPTKGFNIRYLRELSIMISGKKILIDLIKKENIDIIHGHVLYSAGITAAEVGDKYNIPTYITSHGVDTPQTYNKNPILKKAIKRALDKADHVLAVSNDLIQEIIKTDIKNIKQKTSLHKNAVDINRFKEIPHQKEKEKPTIIFVGRLDKRKNISRLLDAKKQTQTDFNLLIVGDGFDRKNLEKKVQKENINGVKFMGFRNDIENILPHADVFILPSLNEGLSIALIEALACGLPVIGSDIKGMKEIITPDVGLLINPYNTTSISNAIDKILTDKKLYNKLQSHARKKAIEFSKMEIPYTELK